MLLDALSGNAMVGSTAGHDGPTRPDRRVSVVLNLDGPTKKTQVSAASMLAPTPDYFTGFNNVEMCFAGRWGRIRKGFLFPYDAGTEKVIGTDQLPRENIAKIIGKPFYGRPVGYYTIRRVA